MAVDSDGVASSQFQEALILIELARPFEALPLLGEVILSQPDFAEAYVRRAQLRRRLNDLEGAIADYAKAIKLAPTVELYLARALVWLGLGKAEGAVGDARRAIALEAGLAGGYRLLGKALGLLGDGEGAIAAYKQAARCYIDAKDKENATLCLGRIEALRSLPPLSAAQQQAIDGYGKDLIAQNMQTAATQTVATPEAFSKSLWLDDKWAEHQQAVRTLRDQQTTTADRKSESSVLIESFERHLPVVEVLFDGITTFDMVIDRNAPHSIITQQMAQQLNLELVSYQYVYLADGVPMELPVARLRSVAIGETVITDVDVAVAPDTQTALLGKNCFGSLSVRISGNKITFGR